MSNPRILHVAGLLSVLFSMGIWGCGRGKSANQLNTPASTPTTDVQQRRDQPRVFMASDRSENPGLVLWWSDVPGAIKNRSAALVADSNTHRQDYVGPDACKSCHKKIHDSWSHHAHRWMNALATEENVKGDFSGDKTISYRGGIGKFYREGKQFRMLVAKGDVKREYEIHQTIGSRFYQYYVGKLLSGPEPTSHRFYHEDHVLPFGYWLDRQEWVPVVHVGEEYADDERPDDPYHPPTTDGVYAPYSHSCNYCHTTFPLGDLLVRNAPLIGKHAPFQLHLKMSDYLQANHPALMDGRQHHEFADSELDGVFQKLGALEASQHAVTLGISCESCHLGCRDHAEKRRDKPRFFPQSPHLYTVADNRDLSLERTATNVNWACGRCHAGSRPMFAAGMSTWNSIEYTDAKLGGCYSKLRCVDCHNPHQTIGKQWSRTPEQDDGSCLTCHQEYQSADARQKHTHHPAGSSGDRCMNCHMPRINEGLQDVVRTHMIYSPTRKDMLEANHPNACNLCHTKEDVNWTKRYLREWYQKDFDSWRYRKGPVAVGWLKSRHQATRLVAADALARTNSKWALPEVIDALDDTYLTNRQFVQLGLEKMTGVRLDRFGYRHYMTKQERQAPIQRIREQFPPQAP